ncbi:MAG: hypothetical protein IKP28_06680 [Clostridia bacterium]|nr:hypothetical protein [Clostridia bacterium]
MDAEELKKKIRETKKLYLREMEQLLTVDEIVQLFQEFKLNEYMLTRAIKSFTSEKIKLGLIDRCNIRKSSEISIIETLSNDSKRNIVTTNEREFKPYELVQIVNNLDLFIELCTQNREFFDQNGIDLFDVTRKLSEADQIALIDRIEELGLTTAEKRQIFATLSR